jgi:hypothetical protein
MTRITCNDANLEVDSVVIFNYIQFIALEVLLNKIPYITWSILKLTSIRIPSFCNIPEVTTGK